MPKLTRDCLSEHDQAVLDSIFNPLQIGSGTDGSNIPSVFDPEITNDQLHDPPEEKTPELEESIKFEIDAIRVAENGDFQKSLEYFKNAIEKTPKRASLYNNRAQVYRLKEMDDDAFADLDKALELSSNNGRTGCLALCQRGILYRKRNNLDAARRDFELAAKLGSKFARTQLVEINPYAALCNQMLRDVFQKLS